MRIYLNRDWQFEGKTVTIPHTVKETPFHYFDESEYQKVSTYQKEIDVPKEWEGKQVLLTFEGVAHVCEVFLNGEKIGEHRCGYTAFTLKLNNLIYGEKNTILIKVDSRESLNVPPFGHVIDYMTYGGIYRDVYLDVKEEIYLQDVFLHTDLQTMTAEITRNIDAENNVCRISLRKDALHEWTELCKENLQDMKTHLQFPCPEVELWDVEHPNMYDIKVELFENENLIDDKMIPFMKEPMLLHMNLIQQG